ncbi:HAD-IA family hydrolase [Psychrobium sp. nBUS_13]|uniref:HAD-IA family hydrolase n=1 Tax=Psychrobium sp. nBUS_13 TaxID=3395319 RepID=UPI003EC00974
MQFYKSYIRPKAIGFDLDDTLYDNRPVLINAEKKLHQFLLQEFPKTQQLTISDWTDIRLAVTRLQPTLQQDITLARQASLKQGLLNSGYTQQQANDGMMRAMEVFLASRNNITLSSSVHDTLALLKKHFRLFVITNGNADIKRFGIDHYFEFALQPSQEISPAIAMKPASDMFIEAEKRLALSGNDILYIGDHPTSDIKGSGEMDWQNGWFNAHQRPLIHYKKPQQLPTFEYNDILQLTNLTQ